MIFKRKPRPDTASADEIRAEIAALMAANREAGDRDRERRILELRHRAGIRYLEEAGEVPEYAQPDFDSLPAGPLPPIAPEDLTAGIVRAGILRDGAVLVRGAVPSEAARALAEGIEQAFADRSAHNAGIDDDDSLYEEFVPEPGFAQLSERNWIEAGGGVLAADSPRLAFEMLDAFERIGLGDVIREYLGEPVAVSAEKCTLRKASPEIGGAWHQDGNFMGDVRALNVWLSLSRCGDVAPGLDLVPKRIDYLVEAGTDGAPLSYVIAPAKAEEAAGDAGIIRPIFEPGDILLFDDLFLHQTGSDPSMPNPRYAIESWFFGASGFPADYAPIAA
ncbi:MAG: phytanoyl-CoA dioxygenase family protein [Solirubrobacterales bacterium]